MTHPETLQHNDGHPLSALRRLGQGIHALYHHADPESARIRGAHLNAVVRLTPFMMAANIGNGALVLWTFSANMPRGLWGWWGVLMVASLLALANWAGRRGSQGPAGVDGEPVASRRAMRRSTWHAVALGSIWAAMPALWFGSATPSQQVIICTLLAGMLGAGTFVLHPLPLASLSFAVIVYAGSMLALWSSGNTMYFAVAALLSFYAPVLMLGSLFTWRKATRLLRSQAQAVRQERMLSVLLHDFEEDADEALWETSVDGHLNHLSPRLAQLLGVTESQVREQPLMPLLAGRCSDGALALQRAFDAGRGFRDLQLVLTDDARTRHLSVKGKRLVDDLGRTTGWRGVLADVSDKVRSENQLRQLAHTDSLTGLANRFTLREALAAAVLQTSKPIDNTVRTVALLSIDLDHFKSVNDSLGHTAGDELLRVVAQRLRACVRPQDLVARLGGDEFAILLSHASQAEDAAALAQRVIDALAQAIEVQGRRLRVGASVGVALQQGTAWGVDELLARADTALYAAKEAGRGRYTMFTPQLSERAGRRLAIEEGLRHAIDADQLSLHWQAKVNIQRWQIVGAEALLRWQHPQLGRVEPVEFIAVAERAGLIEDLGRWALREACRAAQGALAGLPVSVNVSPAQLRDGSFAQQVREVLREFALEPEQLELEITESVLIDDIEGALAQMHALRELGVRIALDDFGTGYSSLAYLRRFPFDTLKLDRAFVSEVLHDKDARAIVRMVAQLADTLGMRTVCEGVETTQQLAAVAQAGCDQVQGFLVLVPRALDEFVRWRMAWRSEPPSMVTLH